MKSTETITYTDITTSTQLQEILKATKSSTKILNISTVIYNKTNDELSIYIKNKK